MIQYFAAYFFTAATFLSLDLIWLGFVAKDFYFNRIGDLLAQPFNIPAAVIFYLLYIVGIMIFAMHPALSAGSWRTALILGGLFGFFCYATYDMTNLATLKDWSVSLVIVDIIWGTLLTASATTVGYLLTKLFF